MLRLTANDGLSTMELRARAARDETSLITSQFDTSGGILRRNKGMQ